MGDHGSELTARVGVEEYDRGRLHRLRELREGVGDSLEGRRRIGRPGDAAQPGLQRAGEPGGLGAERERGRAGRVNARLHDHEQLGLRAAECHTRLPAM